MSKRLSKRQQREQEELEQLKAQEKSLSLPAGVEEEGEASVSEAEDEDKGSDGAGAPVNAFAAVSLWARSAEARDNNISSEERTMPLIVRKRRRMHQWKR